MEGLSSQGAAWSSPKAVIRETFRMNMQPSHSFLCLLLHKKPYEEDKGQEVQVAQGEGS